ncbi:MAG TPA: asparagine synthase (glutamine-hydrolyzing) [Bdellovibrionales bacterium]|nr:asparagine synthase (glutamine-hydrolyzing) [Bdellovibrionales bacterium]
MCGIAGFYDLRSARPNPTRYKRILDEMGRRIAHRGPDDEQQYANEDVALVFRRLSIIDLAGGAQPIWNEAGTICVLVNGEIYNHMELRSTLKSDHRFKTKSDSEIVLHLYEDYGADAVSFLKGKFALAIWDSAARKLVLARDRMGIKPLYYYHDERGLLLFGSELKALLAHPDCPRELDWEFVAPGALRTLGFSSGVKGVQLLEGGCYATFDASKRMSVTRYWSFEERLTGPPARLSKTGDYIRRYEELFAQAIERRMMSDVPVGAFLSGGLDSCMMVGAAAEFNPDLECYTVVERSTVLCGDVEAAEALARSKKLKLHKVVFDYRTFLDEVSFSLATFEYAVRLMDMPMFQLSWFIKHELHRFAKTVNPKLKVVLIGQGADEFAGGYSNIDSPSYGHRDWSDYLSRNVRGGLASQIAQLRRIPEDYRKFLSREYLLSLQELQASDYHREMAWAWQRLQMYNLWHEDRTSSAQGIEARIPFLDSDLVEFLAAIPAELHAELFWDKKIVREASRRWLPASLAGRRKVGFIYGPDRDSADQMYREILRRIFPAFESKYLAARSGQFAMPAIQREYERAIKPTTPFSYAKALLDFMAFIVFREELTAGGAYVIGELRPPSPLRAVADPRAIDWGESRAAGEKQRLRELVGQDYLNLELELNPQLRIKVTLPSLVEIYQDDIPYEKLAVEADQRWILDFFVNAACGPRAKFTINYVATQLGIGVEEIAMVFVFLLSKNIVRIPEKDKLVRATGSE